ncbi:MAG: hypothetical protein JXR60_05195 [Bacteroidales bacterium]|nr:hypothetical protein [Bacteroidales bacterium]
MLYSFKKYQITEIEDAITIDGIKFNSHVIVRFYDAYDLPLQEIKLGVKPIEALVSEYVENKNIILHNCFIKNLNLKKALNIEDRIECKTLSIKNSVIEADTITDFSKLNIDSELTEFSYNYVLKGKLTLHGSKLSAKDNDFSNNVYKNIETDFSNTHWGNNINSFKNSVFFDGFKNFQYANFASGEANFTNVDFGNGDVAFINVDFKNAKANFKVANFNKGKVDFHYTHFGKKDTSFERVNFGEGTVDFSKVDFGESKVNFNRSKFEKGDVNFEGIELKNGKLTFKKTIFGDNAINFSEALCPNSIFLFQSALLGSSTFSFKEAVVKSLSFQSCHLNGYADFRVKSVEEIDLRDSVVRDLLDFIPYDKPVEIATLQLFGMRLIGKLFIDWNLNNVHQLIENQSNTTPSEKAYQYRLLKENFHNTGEYIAEDQAYVAFKRMESKNEYEQIGKQAALRKYSILLPVYYFKELLLDKAGLYATSPVRVLWSMLITYVFFSLIIAISAILQLGSLTGTKSFDIWQITADSFYFSIITYLTVGYGDYCPIGFEKWLAGIEGFVGVFLMAYFTVAFVRRILR